MWRGCFENNSKEVFLKKLNMRHLWSLAVSNSSKSDGRPTKLLNITNSARKSKVKKTKSMNLSWQKTRGVGTRGSKWSGQQGGGRGGRGRGWCTSTSSRRSTTICRPSSELEDKGWNTHSPALWFTQLLGHEMISDWSEIIWRHVVLGDSLTLKIMHYHCSAKCSLSRRHNMEF